VEEVKVAGNVSGLRAALPVFSEGKRFWPLAAWVLGAVAFLKGIRFPNLWSATQAQIDYSHGFIKRGLVGTIFTDNLHLNHYIRFTVFSFAILAIALVALLLLVAHSGIQNRIGDGELVALFFSSFAFTYIANVNGYFDILLLAMTLAMLLVRGSKVRFALALFFCPIALLVHEAFFLLFLPALLFSFFADAVERRTKPRISLIYAGLIAVLCLGIAFLVARNRSLSQIELASLRNEIASRADFPIRSDFFRVMAWSAKENMLIMANMFRDGPYLIKQISATIIFLPVFLLVIFAGRNVCSMSRNQLLNRYGFGLLLCTAAIPLAMHALAWDCARWDAFACVSAFLGLMLVVRAMPQEHFVISPAFRNVTILVIALNMASGETLLDKGPKQYPFVQEVLQFRQHLVEHPGQPPYNE
jgi:hypothetical protein